MIFSVEQGSFSYAERELLRGICFSLQDGEVLSVLGKNGVGKTTLLRAVMGLLPWDGGGSFLDGRDIRTLKKRELFQSIAYVPQARQRNLSFTAEDMILLGRAAYLSFYQNPSERDREEVLQVMRMLGITHLRGKPCDRMSGGELQLVLIGRALVQKPKLLILDEPESNLDYENQLMVLELLRSLSDEGRIVIFNTHYPEHALRFADKALILQRERKNLYGPVRELLTEENLLESFDTEIWVSELRRGEECIPAVTAVRRKAF